MRGSLRLALLFKVRIGELTSSAYEHMLVPYGLIY